MHLLIAEVAAETAAAEAADVGEMAIAAEAADAITTEERAEDIAVKAAIGMAKAAATEIAAAKEEAKGVGKKEATLAAPIDGAKRLERQGTSGQTHLRGIPSPKEEWDGAPILQSIE